MSISRRLLFISFALLICHGFLRAQVGIVYTYPVPNAIRVSPQTGIGIRYAERIDEKSLHSSQFIISGSKSGVHTGSVTLGADGRTIIFTPQHFFAVNENIHVTVLPFHCISGKQTLGKNFSFSTSYDIIWSMPKAPPAATFDTLPADFPPITVTKMDNPAPGNMYLGNFIYSTTKPYGSYLIILDSTMNVLGYRNTYPQWGQDFRPRPNNSFTYYDVNDAQYYGMDSTLTRTTKYSAGNGYQTDQHELLFMPDGGYAILGLRHETVNMISLGGDSAADVIFYALQEFDKNKKLIFQWRCDDSGNYMFTDARYEDISGADVDYAHCNSIEYDSLDNTFILSSRSLDEVTKISRETGKIVWRLGGKNNQFKLLGDSIFFSHQHMPRLLPNGNITLFDNGNFRASGLLYSRALEYKIDEAAKTITKVWEYRHKPDVFTTAMGSVERLPNGNTLIGWGVNDSVTATEVRPDGSVAFEMYLPHKYNNYRFYKFPGRPRIISTFITGFIYDDKNGNKMYDSGEGIKGVTVTLSSGATVVTSDSGYYKLPFSGPGSVTVTASGGTFGTAATQIADYTGKNIEVDFIKPKIGLPAQTQLLSPLSGSIHSDSVQFTWKVVSGATHYRLQLATNASLANIIYEDSTITIASVKFGILKDKGVYYWRVQAENDGGWGSYSILASFSVALPKLPPKAVTLISPADSAMTGTDDIIFLWHPSLPAATSYKFAVDTIAAMTNSVVHGTVYDTTTSIAFTDLAPNTTYFWNVIAVNDVGSSAASEIRSFTTGMFSGVASTVPIGSSISPNPATGQIHIRFSLDEEKEVSLRIYNSIGQIQTSIINGKLAPGDYDYIWDARSTASGVYLYDLRIGIKRETGRIILE